MNGAALPIIAVLGVDTPIGLSVIRELGRCGLTVHGIGRKAHAIGGASKYCAALHVRGQSGLAEWLPELLAAVGADALLAVSEGDLVALSAMPDVIGKCRILTPRPEPLAIVLDKQRTLEVARGIGIRVPDSWQPDGASDWQQASQTLAYPLIAKWSDPPAMVEQLSEAGLDLIKAERIETPAQLLDVRDRYAPIGAWPLIQSFCPGEGVGQMLHMVGRRATLRFQHRRIHEWPPEGGVSTLCETLPDGAFAEQMALSERLLAAIGWQGPAMVEYRHDPATGNFWLMEVNGRFWGSLPLATAANAWFAREQVAQAFPALPIPPEPARRTAKARFMIPETRRLFRILQQGGGEGRLRAVASYVGGFLNPAMRYYVWSLDDPRPMLRDLSNIILRR